MIQKYHILYVLLENWDKKLMLSAKSNENLTIEMAINLQLMEWTQNNRKLGF